MKTINYNKIQGIKYRGIKYRGKIQLSRILFILSNFYYVIRIHSYPIVYLSIIDE